MVIGDCSSEVFSILADIFTRGIDGRRKGRFVNLFVTIGVRKCSIGKD